VADVSRTLVAGGTLLAKMDEYCLIDTLRRIRQGNLRSVTVGGYFIENGSARRSHLLSKKMAESAA